MRDQLAPVLRRAGGGGMRWKLKDRHARSFQLSCRCRVPVSIPALWAEMAETYNMWDGGWHDLTHSACIGIFSWFCVTHVKARGRTSPRPQNEPCAILTASPLNDVKPEANLSLEQPDSDKSDYPISLNAPAPEISAFKTRVHSRGPVELPRKQPQVTFMFMHPCAPSRMR